tara:strand:+ start:2726 stop:3304 length:579 start_codon:yes stop_codon:yes gene_type:complete
VSRGLSNNQNTYLAGNSLIGVTLIHIVVYGGSDLRFTDAPFNISYDGNTFEAQGKFLGISETSETADLQITNINIVLSALDLTLVQTLAKSNQINQQVTVRRAFLDPTDNSLIGDSAGDRAIVIFQGRTAGYRIKDDNNTATLNIEVTSQFSNFNRLSGRRTNQGSLQREHSTDFGFEYSHESIRDIKWGKL